MLHLLIMDQDLWSKALNFHGSLLLQTILNPDEVPEPKNDNEREKQVMCRFIKNRHDMLFKLSDEPPKDPPALEHAVPIVPIEIFRDETAEERRDLFYKSLDRGHILILRVINDTLPDNYKLLVLCKQENHMKLDDLSIIMFLPKLPAELELAGGKLESDDIIRAAVCSCSIDERKLYVTLDSYILEEEGENTYLGKITEQDLPFYFRPVDFGPSYVDYLHNQTSNLSNPEWANELCTVLNLEKNYLYSFMPHMDGKKFAACVYANELRKKQVLAISQSQCAKGQEHYEKGNFSEALVCFNKALSANPKNVDALVSRGILYANTNKVREAFTDTNAALKINPTNEKATKQMSLILVSLARMHIEKNDFQKAQESLDAALFVDTNNQDAVTVFEKLRNMNINDKSSDKSAKASGSGKKDRVGSCSSDSSTSKKGESKEDQEGANQGFNLQVATKMFLSSMKKAREHGKNKKSHRRHKSKSKSPKRTP